jgi:hypothetical protein
LVDYLPHLIRYAVKRDGERPNPFGHAGRPSGTPRTQNFVAIGSWHRGLIEHMRSSDVWVIRYSVR